MFFFLYICFYMFCSQGGGENVDPKFFRENKEICNCRNQAQCNTTTGRCASGLCAKNFVGITCQHASVVMLGVSVHPSELMDGNHSSCASDSFNRIVDLKFKGHFYIFWVHVHRRRTQPMSPEVSAHGYAKNLADSFITGSNSVLIKTDRNYWLVSDLLIEKLPPDTCTVEIGIGRNLAIRGNASQSSDNGYNTAREANDGFEVTHLSRIGRSCSIATPDSKGNSWWNVRLTFNARINLITILTSRDNECLFDIAIIEIFQRGNYAFVQATDQWSFYGKYTLPVPNGDSISQVKVSFSNKDTRCIHKMCEVQVFGEFICPNGKFGELCEFTCTGCTNGNCIAGWGCLEGCVEGKTGHWCQTALHCKNNPGCKFVCSNNCAGLGDCDPANGECLEGCKPGFTTTNCSKPCTSGKYGSNCDKVCSGCSKNKTTNEYMCNAVTGKCSQGCAPGYRGENCQMRHVSNTSERRRILFYTFLAFFLLVVVLILYNIVLNTWKRNTLDDWEDSIGEEEEGVTTLEHESEEYNDNSDSEEDDKTSL